MKDGFSLFNLDDVSYIRGYQTGNVVIRRPKEAVFAEDGKVLVCGTDHGTAYIFDKKREVILDRLFYEKDGLIQALAVSKNIDLQGCKILTYFQQDPYQ